MEIKQISVSNLFGLFNHVIPLKLQEHITIIYGLNGYGKTIILKMLNGLFNREYTLFRTIPYEDFVVEFSDGKSLKVTHGKNEGTKHNSDPKLEYRDANGKIEVGQLSRRKYPISKWMSDVSDEIPELERVGPRSWRFTPTGEILDSEQVVDRFEDYMPPEARGMRGPEWLSKIQKSTNIRFLDVERLIGMTRPSGFWEERSQRRPAVLQYSDGLRSIIQQKLSESATLSQSLDRSFPRRLLEVTEPRTVSSKDLRRKLDELETKRKQLIDAGVLDKERVEAKISGQIRKQDKNVLSVYLADTEKKLMVFDELARKLDIMKRIINSRFKNKQMTTDRKKGFVFISSNGKQLRPSDLSSGEQHEVVMLYELLFKVKGGTIFLIDEPELSLHVGWQMQLVSDLQGIAELGAFHILMATHSPQIINERWDLAVELQGLK